MVEYQEEAQRGQHHHHHHYKDVTCSHHDITVK
jgi:hypothetical protein